ncbi:class F sortase [Kribbella sp. CA-293567]|uniref:class F sortase n=1 Tax=Kribbella sp. CA-293567 TaxID=3002436 RepID=UPI0022DD2267|nr:class F sortase [Kribbella sp. CA-293567]WBQ03513.1 class F sortase [Kribbella sp. CA-293567]
MTVHERPGIRRTAGYLVVVAGLLLMAAGLTGAVTDDARPVEGAARIGTAAPVRVFAEPVIPATPLPAPPTRATPKRPERVPGLPTAVSVPGQVKAPVVAVGVRGDRSLMLPPVGQVGWWTGGSVPGQVGTTVLAAHLDDDQGRVGVFAGIGQLPASSRIVIETIAGTASYRVSSVQTYRKTSLPKSLFSRVGPARLVMITCGGSYVPGRGYSDNIVVTAVPA